ncbi:putative aspartic peptidase domain superfamily [Helianthus annuus]|nr:putative aspartic peptidase domain superfamily [Helianthus annuus]KAJ0601279.1 putative aspartic peptidase domain superfamily [Helianthus annuus]KAJ0608420.1 putative aspartic peptidase domain superfamily [Helianthus annuus]KAJ0768483.1 putative aspartic peptidase domain superfamily [Helianthus annuus]KAJ0936151.1 putative aspartic peptidase domain superfamily [Helianthus annuus]
MVLVPTTETDGAVFTSDSSSTVRATVVQKALVMTSSGTADAVRCSEEVKSDKKGKGVVMSSTFGCAIDIDSDDDSCYGKDYINLSSDESESEDDYAVLQSRFDNIDLPTGVEAAIPHFVDSIKMKNKIKVNGSKTSAGSGLRVQRSAMKVHAEPANGLKISVGSGLLVQRGARKVHAEPANVLRKYRNFKKFDIVEDYSDHHYSGLTKNVSSILSGALPPKLQDPGNPIISIQVGEFKMSRALLDFGACVNILPGSLYDQYEFGPLQASKSTVTLADLTRRPLRGMVTDVIVKVEDFYYPVDFLVLDYVSLDRTKQPTVILGRPFLATSNAQINCKSGTVNMTFGNRWLRLNVFSGLTNPLVNDECYMADRKDYINLSFDESESEDDYAVLQSRFDNIDLPTGVEAAIPHFADSIKMKNKIKVNGSKTSAGSGLRVQRSAMKVHVEPANGLKVSAGSGLRVQSGARKVHAEPANVLRKYRNFKKFDIIEYYSDHHYSGLTENVSSIPSGALPPKLQDPGNPIISIQVGEFKMIRALLDSGAGMSIIPGSLYDQYEFGPLQASKSTVELADLTCKSPRGIVTDVIVKVEDFYYPVDFLVLDYVSLDRTKHQSTVILGRPFLATSNAQINCKSGTVNMTFGNRRLRLNVFSGLTNPLVNDVCYMADSVDECIPLSDTGVDEENTMGECFMFDRLQTETNRSIDEEEKKLEVMAVREGRSLWTHQVGSLPDKIDTKLKPSLVEPLTVELKVLPKHLKYACVGEGNTLPVIISSK